MAQAVFHTQLQELARRCDTLIRLVEKENEEYDAKEGGGRKTGAAKTPGPARPRAQAAGEGAPPARVLVSPYVPVVIVAQADCRGPNGVPGAGEAKGCAAQRQFSCYLPVATSSQPQACLLHHCTPEHHCSAAGLTQVVNGACVMMVHMLMYRVCRLLQVAPPLGSGSQPAAAAAARPSAGRQHLRLPHDAAELGDDNSCAAVAPVGRCRCRCFPVCFAVTTFQGGVGLCKDPQARLHIH